jgi:hypothetical protein
LPTLLAGGGANTVKALGALLDKIRPAIVHSQSGAYASIGQGGGR